MTPSTVRGPRAGDRGAPRAAGGRTVGNRSAPVARLPGWFTDRPLSRAIGIAIGLCALGFVVGSMGAFAHAIRLSRIPVGLPVALLAEGGVVVAAGVCTAARSAAALPALGWALSVLVLSSPRPEGDVIIAANGIGYAYLLGGLVLLGLLTVLPYDRFVGPGGRPVPRDRKQ